MKNRGNSNKLPCVMCVKRVLLRMIIESEIMNISLKNSWGAAHNKCNLKMRQPDFIPVILHNLANYDAHLFIKAFGKEEGDLNAICQTDEKYISFSHRIDVDPYIDKEGNS